MATDSNILAQRIPWMEAAGGLQSMGSQRVGCNEQLSMHTCCAKSTRITTHYLNLILSHINRSAVSCNPSLIDIFSKTIPRFQHMEVQIRFFLMCILLTFKLELGNTQCQEIFMPSVCCLLGQLRWGMNILTKNSVDFHSTVFPELECFILTCTSSYK